MAAVSTASGIVPVLQSAVSEKSPPDPLFRTLSWFSPPLPDSRAPYARGGICAQGRYLFIHKESSCANLLLIDATQATSGARTKPLQQESPLALESKAAFKRRVGTNQPSSIGSAKRDTISEKGNLLEADTELLTGRPARREAASSAEHLRGRRIHPKVWVKDDEASVRCDANVEPGDAAVAFASGGVGNSQRKLNPGTRDCVFGIDGLPL